MSANETCNFGHTLLVALRNAKLNLSKKLMKIAKITSLKKRISGVLTASLAVALLSPMLLINAAPAAPTGLTISKNSTKPTITWNKATSAAIDASNWINRVSDYPLEWQGKTMSSAVVFNDKMWLMGGVGSMGPTNDVWSSVDGSEWVRVTDSAPWQARTEASAVVLNGKIWLFGGTDQTAVFNDVWSSDNGYDWQQVTADASWAARSGHSAVVLNNKIWLFGGVDGSGGMPVIYNDVWSTADGVNWMEVNSSAEWGGRVGQVATVFNNKILIVGGFDLMSNAFLNDAWSSSDGISWSQLTAAADWSPRMSSSLNVAAGKIWLMGGVNLSEMTGYDDVWSSSDGITWDMVAENAPWGARGGHAAFYFNNKFWVIDGMDPSSPGNLGDVWSTFDTTIAGYKLCWDRTESGCANSVKVSPDGNVVASSGSVVSKLKQTFLPSVIAATNQVSYTFTNPLDTGKWYFSVYSVDGEGNQSVLAATTSTEITPGLPDTGTTILLPMIVATTLALVGYLFTRSTKYKKVA